MDCAAPVSAAASPAAFWVVTGAGADCACCLLKQQQG